MKLVKQERRQGRVQQQCLNKYFEPQRHRDTERNYGVAIKNYKKSLCLCASVVKNNCSAYFALPFKVLFGGAFAGADVVA